MSLVSVTAQSPTDNKLALGAAQPEPTQPATAFADLLDKPADDAKKAKKAAPAPTAYSFAELGMFGLHALVDGQSGAPAAAAKATAHARTVSAKAKDTAAAPTQPAAQPLVYVPYIYGEIASVPVQSVTPTAAASAAAPVSAAMPAPAKSATTGIKPGAPRTAPQLPKDPAEKVPVARPAADRVSVAIAGPDDALKIAVRAEPSSEVVKLRRLIEATVAHFEMDMAELHFNGNSMDTAFSLGGMNGGLAG
ncbi:MAG TPA: hypothetical protein VG889_09575 [Rhizomicrobium sp.]|nr:hypothetical protein [Rhizomicrobium sp.]